MSNRRDQESMKAAAMAGELGFGIAAPLVVCTGLGWYLDGLWGTGHWLVMTGLLLGIVSTIGTFYRLATAFPARTPPKKGAPGAAPPADGTGETHGGPGPR